MSEPNSENEAARTPSDYCYTVARADHEAWAREQERVMSETIELPAFTVRCPRDLVDEELLRRHKGVVNGDLFRPPGTTDLVKPGQVMLQEFLMTPGDPTELTLRMSKRIEGWLDEHGRPYHREMFAALIHAVNAWAAAGPS